ncbi:DUF397 domain-containing protein [Saccharopolyspora sp. ASAGF58]|uniref:DUF397 domain-containing protein n=1 Tax=Saccharopolyspora TaxID=1835 RepID=UPI00144007A8|nr:DUF397 domain-containing protein [Saccharopolyspora sp. ASAGF58]QIZ35866.1 DUF397 domain-containing protein [Saccharopolyspora sp. ASAGF58]
MFKWRKSSRSGSQECVEVATNVENVRAIRDSKEPGGAHLRFDPDKFAEFMMNVKRGRFDA